QGGTLELDINYMYRVPLWPISKLDSPPVGSRQVLGIPVLDIHELAGGKLAALLSRGASRDLFDTHYLLTNHNLEAGLLRTAFVLYGAMNRRDWRQVTVDDVRFDARELRNQLIPVLSGDTLARMSGTQVWSQKLVDECKDALLMVLPFTDAENEFLDRLLGHGEIRADVLGLDPRLTAIVQSHPALLWKARNVRGNLTGSRPG
ncbi:nucleotidyl transferase AbiEii/AbiGii toxin family protein, partial [Halorhodospira halochloris]